MHLIQTNHQINMTFGYFVSRYKSFKKYLNAKSFKMFWEQRSSCKKRNTAVSVFIARVMRTCKRDVNSTLVENSKDPHH